MSPPPTPDPAQSPRPGGLRRATRRLAARLARGLAAFALLLLAGVAAAGEAPPWRALETPRYTVVSQLDDAQTRAWAAEFDLFIASLTDALGFHPDRLPPLTVVLFASDEGFDGYRPAKPSGEIARNVCGVFYRRETWGVIGLAAENQDAATRSTIFHEGVHWLMSADPAPLPRWFSEGIAELYSTFGVDGGKVHWGDPINGYTRLLRRDGLLPLRDFLAQRSSLFEGDEHTGAYYAQSWALTHLLLLGGDAARRAQLRRFLDAYEVSSEQQAFREGFDDDYDALERALRDYVAGDPGARGEAPTPRLAYRYRVAAAPPAVVEAALGRLALGAADADLARRHAARLQQLEPRAARTQELLTYIAQRDEDVDAALEHARAAVARRSKDAEMYLVTAAGLLPTDELAARRRVDLIRAAIRLNPRSQGAYSMLLEAMADGGPPGQRELELLRIGRQALPHNGVLQLGFAEQLYRLGQRVEARSELDRLLLHPERLDDTQQRYARSLQSKWRFTELNERVDPLIEAGRYAEADAVLAGAHVEDEFTRAYVAWIRQFLQSIQPAPAHPANGP